MDISTLENERRRAIQEQGDLRMGVSGGWNVASSNLNQPGESAPYIQFRRDVSTDDPEVYRGQPVFGVEKDGQMFFDFPFVQAPQKQNNMMIADRTYTADDALMPLESGAFLNKEDGIYGHVLQNEGGYLKEGKMYDQGIHGLPIPLV